jgi:uncharacterized membrane protein AbrB (regulator of aidB expression)
LAFALVGAFIGTRFVTVTARALIATLRASVGAFVVALSVTGAVGFAVAAVTGRPLGEVLVAFAPGGLEAMMIFGAALGLDPLYVGLHHLLRFFGIALLLPIATRALRLAPPAGVPSRHKE